MDSLLEKFAPHIMVIAVFFYLPPEHAIYVFIALYILGVGMNLKKERDDALNSDKKEPTPWWEILGTTQDASVKECARVRKLLTKIYHPDGGQAANAEAMQRINDAFEDRASRPDAASQGIIH